MTSGSDLTRKHLRMFITLLLQKATPDGMNYSRVKEYEYWMCQQVKQKRKLTREKLFLRFVTTVWVVGETNYVIYKFTFIDINRHTPSLIHIHLSSMIINQTMVELFDIRFAQNHILDEDVM